MDLGSVKAPLNLDEKELPAHLLEERRRWREEEKKGERPMDEMKEARQ